MTKEEELREVKLEIARLEHKLRLAEIEAKKKADLELEEQRAQHALILEEQRGKNSITVENRKGLWALGAAIGGCLLGVLEAENFLSSIGTGRLDYIWSPYLF